MIIHLPGERAPSWNLFYSGQHWEKRRKLAARVREAVRSAMPTDTRCFSRPVRITLVACYARQLVDPDNVCAKLYVDALKGRVLRDDDPSCVLSVTTISRRAKRPSVTIEELVEDFPY